MVRTISGIIHGECVSPLARTLSTISLTEGFNSSGLLVLNPNPTPPANTPLGAALRRLVPPIGQGHCDYVEEIMAALKLEDNFIPSSPTHILRPNTALRSELDFQQMHEAALDNRMKPDCMKQKDVVDTGQLIQKGVHKYKRAPLGTSLRLKGDCGGWGTYSQTSSTRRTAVNVQLTDPDEANADSPGPGTYKRPVSTMRQCRTGVYPSVGKLRTVGSAVMGSVQDRFA